MDSIVRERVLRLLPHAGIDLGQPGSPASSLPCMRSTLEFNPAVVDSYPHARSTPFAGCPHSDQVVYPAWDRPLRPKISQCQKLTRMRSTKEIFDLNRIQFTLRGSTIERILLANCVVYPHAIDSSKRFSLRTLLFTPHAGSTVFHPVIDRVRVYPKADRPFSV